MGATGHLREGDGDAILRLIEDARRDDAGPGMPWALLEGLQRLLRGGSAVEYQELDVVGGRFAQVQSVGADGIRAAWIADGSGRSEEERTYFDLWWDDPMCSYPQRSGDLRTVLLSSDFFPTLRDLDTRPIRDAVTPGLTSLMETSLPSPAGLVRRIMVARCGGPALGERERQIVALVRPHLDEIRVEAELRRAGVPRLTPREWQVLALVASGLSHADVAARLVVSVSTVHKHMENVRERLGVRSAAAAAAIALPHAPSVPHPRVGGGTAGRVRHRAGGARV